MYSFKRVLVALDQTANDRVLVRFADYLCSRIDIDKIYFVHVSKNLEWPPEILEKYPDCLAPIDENIEVEIKDHISRHLSSEFLQRSEIIVLEGNPEQKLLKEVIIKEIDLFVMGNKPESDGTGRIPRKMANLAHCSIALVSDSILGGFESQFRMMVAFDFNSSSVKAFSKAKEIHDVNEDREIILHHIYNVPSGYHKSGKSFDEFAEIMKENAEKKLEKSVKNEDLDITNSKKIFSLDTNNNIAKKIFEVAENEGAHLIVIGSRGRTGPASILLGSTAEKLTTYSNRNILIVKDKRHNMDLLDALMEI